MNQVERFDGAFPPNFLKDMLNYNMTIPLGMEDGLSGITMFGKSPDVPSGAGLTEIWDCSCPYVFDTEGQELNISSSDNSDNKYIYIFGLDATGRMQEQLIQVNGQTQVQIPHTWLRVFRAMNVSPTSLNPAEFSGTIYIYVRGADVTDGEPNEASDVRAKLLAVHQRSTAAFYTVPKNYVGLGIGWSVNISKDLVQDKTIDAYLFARAQNTPFTIRSTAQLSTDGAPYSENFSPFIVLPERSDVKISLNNASGAGVIASGRIWGVLIPKKAMPNSGDIQF